MLRPLKSLFILAFVLSAPVSGASQHGDGGSMVSLDAFLEVLGAGDQRALERYILETFDPKVLEASSAAERADRLARLYVDSGGFNIDRRVRRSADGEVAVATAKVTLLPSCLVLKTGSAEARQAILEFEAVDLPLPASRTLTTPAPPEAAARLRAFMDRLSRSDIFSGVILLAKDGQPFLHKAYGHSDVDGKVRNALDTRFNIASIGKSITAVMIAQLIDEGRLSLDDKVGRFLPDYPDRDVRDKVTIRHLLTHTSGLGEKSEFTNSPLWAKATILKMDDYIPLIVGHPLASEPGARYSYSNAGFVILGKIIEAVSGRSFYEVAASRIFKPAGMRNSFYQDPSARHPKAATALTNFIFEGSDYVYRLGKKSDATGDSAVKGGAHGGAFVTAADLLRFMNAVRAAKLTSARTAKLLMSPQGPGPVAGTANGFGFEIVSQNGHTIIGHRGGDIGVSAFVYHFEPTGYTAVVLSNFDPRAIRAISRKIRGLLTRKLIGVPAERVMTECDRRR